MAKHFIFRENGCEGQCGPNVTYRFRDDNGGIDITWRGEDTRHYEFNDAVIVTTGPKFPDVVRVVAPKRRHDLLAWFCGFSARCRSYSEAQYNELVRHADEVSEAKALAAGDANPDETKCYQYQSASGEWKLARRIDRYFGRFENVAILIDPNISSAAAEELLRTYKLASYPSKYIMDHCKRVGLDVTI